MASLWGWGIDSAQLSICMEVASERREACHVDVLVVGWVVRLSLQCHPSHSWRLVMHTLSLRGIQISGFCGRGKRREGQVW